ncbi:P-loop containing nucleoside triphosphate hydrolase protein [Hyaloraphidium curvatum]|nr:P-loop containing nucleoside triphosphate hydrolase protein [Hyaloraphidium curvatum]
MGPESVRPLPPQRACKPEHLRPVPRAQHTMAATVPVGGVELSWSELRYQVNVKAKRNNGSPTKVVLDCGSGRALPGRILAVMGPSGAGKSTFLSCISNRVRAGGLSGALAVDGVTVSPGSSTLKHLSTFVMQEEALYGSLTVVENIRYAAELSLPNLPRAKREKKVEQAISEMGLERVRDSIIGTVIQRGVSGGEKRRTSIASQLVTDPKILFLDEPTSGLDSAAAYRVMDSVRKLAVEAQVTVVATIHQPSTETFNLFDDLLLLAPGGRTVYFGPREGAIDYFASIERPCPPYFNPADFFLEQINVDFMKDRTAAAQQIDEIVQAWKEHGFSIKLDGKDAMEDVAKGPSGSIASVTGLVKRERKHTYKANILQQTLVLTRRNFLNYSRNIIGYGIRLAMYVAMAILMGLVWMRIGYGQAQIADRFSVYFFSVAFLGFMSVAGIPSFLEERQVFMRERANGLYGCLAHTIANTLVVLPYLFVISLVFTAIAYPMIGLNPGASHFFQFLAYLYLGLLAAEFQAIWVSALVPIFVAALAITSFLNGFWMCVQGYFVKYINLPVWLRVWATQIDYQRYTFELMAANDLSGQTFTCDEIPSGNSTQCFCMFPSTLPPSQCAFTGNDVMDYYEIGGATIGNWVGVLVAICCVFRIFFYVTLRLQKPRIS